MIRVTIYDLYNPNNFAQYLTLEKTKWIGVEQSLEYLQQYINVYGPFDALIGFSQGAHFATLVASKFKFNKIVYISGMLYPLPIDYQLTKPICPTLHIYSPDDKFISAQQSEYLLKFCSNGVLYTHNKGHTIPQTAEAKQIIKRFLETEN